MRAVASSVFQRKDGRWVAVYKLEGKRKCVYEKTKDDAINKRDEIINKENQSFDHSSISNPTVCSRKSEAFYESKQIKNNLNVETQSVSKHEVVSVAINKLVPFNRHPFRLYEGERLGDMVSSIKAKGVLVPIIVRRAEKTLEILAGHNRVNAARLAGLDKINAIILENLSDEDAMVYVIETNLIQRSFTDMTHSEKAIAIGLHHSKMFSQGKRNDIIMQLKTLEKQPEYDENKTYEQVAHKLKSRDIVAKEYGLSKDTVARYLRINQLIPELKSLLDNGDIAFITAVTLSFLKEDEQKLLIECMEDTNCKVSMKKADTLRQFSEKGKFNSRSVCQILVDLLQPKVNHIPTVKVDKDVYEKYFKPNHSDKEVQEIIKKALELYFSCGI